MALVWADRTLETTVTVGTGALALSGAITGYQTFAAVCSVADTVYYSIIAVDASSVPSGAWETGLGTYSAANQLTRTTVLASSNGGAAVDFAAGTKLVMLTPTAAMQPTQFMTGLLDDVDAATARTTLGLGTAATAASGAFDAAGTASAAVAAHVAAGDPHTGYALESALGTMSTQNANSVAITGGSVAGITDLAVADGGTGASTASAARTNLGADVYLVSLFATTAPTTSEVLCIHIVTDAFTFPANFASPASKGVVGTNPASTFAIDVQRQVNATGAFATIGTISISTGGAFTFTTASGTAKAIAVNDVIKCIAPSSADAAILNLAVTLRGGRD